MLKILSKAHFLPSERGGGLTIVWSWPSSSARTGSTSPGPPPALAEASVCPCAVLVLETPLCGDEATRSSSPMVDVGQRVSRGEVGVVGVAGCDMAAGEGGRDQLRWEWVADSGGRSMVGV